MTKLVAVALGAGLAALASAAPAQTDQTDQTRDQAPAARTEAPQGGEAPAAQGGDANAPAAEAQRDPSRDLGAPGTEPPTLRDEVGAPEIDGVPEEPAGPQSATLPADRFDIERFVAEAASAGAFEIESSRIALDRSQDRAVRAFAERMIAEHEAANRKLAEAAQAENLEAPPAEPMPHHQELLALLRDTDADSFDLGYVEVQGWAHRDAIGRFEAYGEREGPVGAFVHEALPTLRSHYEHVLDMQGY